MQPLMPPATPRWERSRPPSRRKWRRSDGSAPNRVGNGPSWAGARPKRRGRPRRKSAGSSRRPFAIMRRRRRADAGIGRVRYGGRVSALARVPLIPGGIMRLESGTVIEASALLFDMDGTLIDSRVVVEKIWKRWCEENGIDWHYVLPRLHGVRMLDSVRMFVKPGMDVDAVYQRLYTEEIEDVDGIVPIPGALELLGALPASAWTIVT